MLFIYILEVLGIDLGGIFRLGLYDCKIELNIVVYKFYGYDFIKECYRYCYEFNN